MPDEKMEIIGAVVEAFRAGADVVVTSGGTGIASRDVTIESLKPLFDKELVYIYEDYIHEKKENTAIG